MSVKLIAITHSLVEGIKTPEELIVYCARVSNPSNQKNTQTAPKLIEYCLKNKHWSIFEQVDMTVEIITSRAIAAQIIRHKSFSFQEFSQRYAIAQRTEPVELRQQSGKNRQCSEEIVIFNKELENKINQHFNQCFNLYHELLNNNIAKEVARFVLPMATTTTLYMKGSVRSWLTYLNLRLHKHTQKEHRLIAEKIRDIFIENFPIISKVFNNFQEAYNQPFLNKYN